MQIKKIDLTFIVVFFLNLFLTKSVFSVEIIEHWAPSEMYEMPYEKSPENLDTSCVLLKKAEDFYKKGKELEDKFKKGEAKDEFRKSKEVLQKIIDINPNLPKPYSFLAEIEMKLGNTAEAETYYIRYMKLAKKEIMPYIYLSQYYNTFNKLEDSRKILSDALKNVDFDKPSNKYPIHNNLGAVYYWLQNYTQAEFHLHEAIRSLNYHEDPIVYIKAVIRLAKVTTLHGDITKDHITYNDAIDILSEIDSKAIKDNDQLSFDFYSLRGYLNGKLGHYNAAKKDLVSALSLNLKAFDITTMRNLKRAQRIKELTLIQRYPPAFVAFLALIFAIVIFRLFIIKKIEEKSFFIGTIIGFSVMLLCIFLPQTLPNISSIKLYGVEIDFQSPVFDKSLQSEFELPILSKD